MTIKIGDRAKFVKHDTVFHYGEREGKTGTVVADASLNQGNNFAQDTACFWKIDGEEGWYLTAIDDLAVEGD